MTITEVSVVDINKRMKLSSFANLYLCFADTTTLSPPDCPERSKKSAHLKFKLLYFHGTCL